MASAWMFVGALKLRRSHAVHRLFVSPYRQINIKIIWYRTSASKVVAFVLLSPVEVDSSAEVIASLLDGLGLPRSTFH